MHCRAGKQPDGGINSQHRLVLDTGAKISRPAARAVAPARRLDYDAAIGQQDRSFNIGQQGGNQMASAVNAGARLDRLPISSFHYRIFWLVGAGMFFDGYDLYVAGGVLASAIQTKFSTLPQNLQFLSLTFVGMTHRRADHRLCRRPVRPALHLSDQSADLRAGLARRRLRAGHEPAHRLPLRAGARPRRRDRGRLFDADRIRAAEDARPLAGLHGVPGGGGIPGHRAARLSDHPELGAGGRCSSSPASAR